MELYLFPKPKGLILYHQQEKTNVVWGPTQNGGERSRVTQAFLVHGSRRRPAVAAGRGGRGPSDPPSRTPAARAERLTLPQRVKSFHVRLGEAGLAGRRGGRRVGQRRGAGGPGVDAGPRPSGEWARGLPLARSAAARTPS